MLTFQYGYWLLTNRPWICNWILWQNGKLFLYLLWWWKAKRILLINCWGLQVRIFQYNGGHSREIYHTKRMQRFVSSVIRIIHVLLCGLGCSLHHCFVCIPWALNLVFFFFGLHRVFCVKFSCDASYVISGSDDTNLRLWKAKASEQLGVVSFIFSVFSLYV